MRFRARRLEKRLPSLGSADAPAANDEGAIFRRSTGLRARRGLTHRVFDQPAQERAMTSFGIDARRRAQQRQRLAPQRAKREAVDPEFLTLHLTEVPGGVFV